MVPARGDGEYGKRIGLASGEVARALHRVHGDVGLEGRAWAPQALAARRLWRLALPRLADHHDGVVIDLGERC